MSLNLNANRQLRSVWTENGLRACEKLKSFQSVTASSTTKKDFTRHWVIFHLQNFKASVRQARRRSNLRTGPLLYIQLDQTSGASHLNIVLERERGSLTLTSTPRGATVLIDGQEKGKTPLKLSRFDAGEYTVTLKLNDHKEFTQRMILQGGQDAVLNATLVTQPSIKLTSRPTGA